MGSQLYHCAVYASGEGGGTVIIVDKPDGDVHMVRLDWR